MANKRTPPSHPNVVSMKPSKRKEERKCGWDDWVIPASDEKGHSVNLQFKAPPQWRGIVNEIVNSDTNPFRSTGDFYRNAFLRLANYLRGEGMVEPGTGSTIAAMNAMADIVNDDEKMDRLRSIFEGLDARVADHRGRGNDAYARRIVLKIWAQVKTIEDEFWRGEFEKEMHDRYGEFIRPKGKCYRKEAKDESRSNRRSYQEASTDRRGCGEGH